MIKRLIYRVFYKEERAEARANKKMIEELQEALGREVMTNIKLSTELQKKDNDA